MTAVAFLLPLLCADEFEPEGLHARLSRFVESQEIEEADSPPSWYPPGPVRFRFVQISDVHLTRAREALLLDACRFVNERVAPAFVVFTGDNAGTSTREGQQHFHDLVARTLAAPFFVLRGDNWPRNFTPVFGSFQWGFDCGGLHFIGSGLDVDVEMLGIGCFLPETLAWLAEEFDRNAGRPIVYFQHEPIQPPTFLDARKLDAILEASPAVAMTMTGHLHADIESRTGRVRHIVAPALGPHRRHGFKVAEVFPDQIVVRTVEREGSEFRFVHKYQRVPLSKAAAAEAPAIRDLKKRPARDTTFDRGLLSRRAELAFAFLSYAAKAGKLGELFKAAAGAKAPAESKATR